MEKILELIKTGKLTNIELACQLAAGQDIDFSKLATCTWQQGLLKFRNKSRDSRSWTHTLIWKPCEESDTRIEINYYKDNTRNVSVKYGDLF